jgi:glyoxylase-like metal-dependent hydrolase (beta-lactamase superfamily II)
MNQLESRLQYPFDRPGSETLPAPGQTLEVAPGVRWIRMALPFALNHINLWLLRDNLESCEGWTVVDCCIDRPESRAQWEQIFANELEGLPILRVIVTHMHPDHIGLAHWLCERWSTAEHTCRLWISSTDFNAAKNACNVASGHGGEAAAAFVQSHGISNEEHLSKIRQRTGYYQQMVPAVPASYVRLMDGIQLRIGAHAWRCIVGYGHAPEHISLYCEALQVLISGDMMLPRISTNVSVYDLEPEANPLALFLASIDHFKPLPAETLVLPSHGKPFRGLHERIDQLHTHHQERLQDVMQACQQRPMNAHEIVPILFKRELDLHQLTFAQGEALAHLHALWLQGMLMREKVHGIYAFSVIQLL